jgi:hypothetical protein
VVRTSANSDALDASSTVKAQKQLFNAERAFCCLKTNLHTSCREHVQQRAGTDP